MSTLTSLPLLVDTLKPEEGRGSTTTSIDCTGENIELLSAQYNVESSVVFEATWALVLAEYTRSETVNFYSIRQSHGILEARRKQYEIDENLSLSDLISNATTDNHVLSPDEILNEDAALSTTHSIVIASEGKDDASDAGLYSKHKVC